MMPERPPDIFVSYAHKDRERVDKLVEFLKNKGWSIWWDSDISAGTTFDEAIRKKLEAARCVIVVWSPNSVRSNFVFDEARIAYERNVVVPVVIDGAKVPLGFGRIQYVDLDQPDGLEKLVTAVSRVLEEKPPVPPDPDPGPRWRWVAAVFLAVVCAIAGYLWSQRAPMPSLNLFLQMREDGHVLASEAMLGLTLWELRAPRDTDPPYTRALLEPPEEKTSPKNGAARPASEYTPVRVRGGASLSDGAKLRLGVESSRDGFLYVIDRELHRDQTLGPPRLIFPTARSEGDGNRISRGRRLELPPLGARMRYWDLGAQQADYSGELLILIVSPQKIPELEGHTSPTNLAEDTVLNWERRWGTGAHRIYTGDGGELFTPAEARERSDSGYLFKPQDPPPNTIEAVPAPEGRPVLAKFPLRVEPKAAQSPAPR